MKVQLTNALFREGGLYMWLTFMFLSSVGWHPGLVWHPLLSLGDEGRHARVGALGSRESEDGIATVQNLVD